MDVTVSDASGKLAYQGRTGSNGTFSTGKLAPGQYVVQFNAQKSAVKGEHYALVVSAGKKKVTAESVEGEKFAAGGVAVKVEVGRGLGITGQVATNMAAMASTDGKVKVINGKRYVWVATETGSGLGGRWVEEGTPSSANLTRMSNDGVHAVQEQMGHGGGPGN
jgi:hypothetical protein